MALWFLVEDDAADRDIMLEAAARVDGVTVEVFASGTSMLERLDEGVSPSLVLLDLGLPDVGGAEIIAEVREHESTSALPVIVVSGNTNLDVVDRAYRNGANSYFEKPSGLRDTVELFDQLARHWERALLPR